MMRKFCLVICLSSRPYINQSCEVSEVSPSLTNVGSLAVGAFDLVNCSPCLLLGSSLSVTLVSKCRNVVVSLWHGLHECCRAVGSVRWSKKCP